MAQDPRQGFPLTADARIAYRVRELERAVERILRNPTGGVAAYAVAPGSFGISVPNVWTPAPDGPTVSLRVPDAGALVELYAEADGAVPAGAGPARATVFETTDYNAGAGHYLEWTAAASAKRRLTAAVGGTTVAAGFGNFVTYWATGGLRTYELRYWLGAAGSGSFSNRRLWARVRP